MSFKFSDRIIMFLAGNHFTLLQNSSYSSLIFSFSYFEDALTFWDKIMQSEREKCNLDSNAGPENVSEESVVGRAAMMQ